MTDTYSGDLVARIRWDWKDDDGTTVDNGSLTTTTHFGSGTDSEEAEACWHLINADLLDTASVTYDLTALTRQLFGDTHTTSLTTVRGLLIKNLSTSEGSLIIGGAGSSEWSAPFGLDGDTVIIPPNGLIQLANLDDGWSVDDTHKNLKLAATGGDVDYHVAIVGTLSAVGTSSSS